MPKNALRSAIFSAVVFGSAAATANAQLTIEIKDYVTMPMTGLVDGKGSNDALLARVNTLREEPGGANRFFITDLNGPVYILDKDNKKFTTYLDFNGHDGHGGFHVELDGAFDRRNFVNRRLRPGLRRTYSAQEQTPRSDPHEA